MRVKIYRQLKKLGFLETGAKKMSAEFTRVLKKLGVACAQIAASLVKSLTASLLHTWVLAFII